MKNILNKFIGKVHKEQKGQILALVLVLLLLGAIILAPVLAYGSTTLKATIISETTLDQLYAANAGVRDAIWQIKNSSIPTNPGGIIEYQLYDVNGETLDVIIQCLYYSSNTNSYEIISTARSNGTSTQIKTQTAVYPAFFGNAVTSRNTITIPSEGNPSLVLGRMMPNPDVVPPIPSYTDPWPSPQELVDYYTNHPGLKPAPINPPTPKPLYYDHAPGNWNLSGDPIQGATYVDGNLDIRNTGGGTITLLGTLWVNGDLDFANNNDWTLDLNGQSIFAEGDIRFGGDKVTIAGSGVIAAGTIPTDTTGDILFQPHMDSKPDECVLVFSSDGTTRYQPSGDFSGIVAGEVDIRLQPGGTFTHKYPDIELFFPILNGGTTSYQYTSWEVTRSSVFTVINEVLPDGQLGVAYNPPNLRAFGGTPPYTWLADSPAPPAWLNISSDGIISGTPTAIGTFEFGVKVTDNESNTVTKVLSVTIDEAATQLDFTTQPAGVTTNQTFTTQPVITVQDSYGNTVTSSSAPVSIAITTGTGTAGAVLSGTTTVNAINGVATFTDLSIDLTGGEYTLTATSTGLTDAVSDPFNVSDTVTLNPSKDAYIYSGSPNSNYNNNNLIEGKSSGKYYRTLAQFDLSSLAGKTVESVSLEFYITDSSGTDNGVSVYQITGTWTENGVTWNDAPTYISTASAVQTVSSTGVWVSWNSPSLISDVQDFIDNPTTNHGWIIINSSPKNSTSSSSEGTYPPKLIVTFH